MLPRALLVLCVLHSLCHADETTEQSTTVGPDPSSKLNQYAVGAFVTVVTMFSVLLVLVPTQLYYRYCAKEDAGNTWPAESH